MRKLVTLAMVATVLIGLNGIVGYAADEDLIPPEILRQMDPDIRSGKRPTITTIRQGDIFNLRNAPRFATDFVTFDFAVGSLSTVQKEIVENWIRSGVNRVVLQDSQITACAPLLAPAQAEGSHKEVGYYGAKLLLHPVNTDCRQVQFRGYTDSLLRCFKSLPPDATAIVERNGGGIVCGSFPLERGEVVFKLRTGGNDSRRWELNFWHWALGLPVPGAAETGVAGSSSLTLAQAAQYDAVILKNGDTITGEVLNESFTVKTSYAALQFERSKLDKIDLEGAGANVDIVTLRVGDKISIRHRYRHRA